MQLGVVVRNMGPQSTRETLVAAARAVDAAPAIADLWVTDHLAIPPDQAEGSEGRYLDPLATLAFLAGVTTRVGLGTAVLVLPDDRSAGRDLFARYAMVGATRVIHGARYADVDAFRAMLDRLVALT